MRLKNQHDRLIIFVVILIILVVFIFIIFFRDLKVSRKPSEWQIFSSYFNDILSPILLTANIYFLIKLTYAVSFQNEKNILNQMRQTAYTEFLKKLYLINEIFIKENKKEAILMNADEIYAFSSSMKYLFTRYENFQESALEIQTLLRKIGTHDYTISTIHYSDESSEYITFTCLYKEFILKRQSFIMKLQEVIIQN